MTKLRSDRLWLAYPCETIAFFIGNGRIIQFGATSAPLIINNWMVPNTASRNLYGRVAAGVVAPVSDKVALTASVSQTFARQGGNDFYGNGGLKISF